MHAADDRDDRDPPAAGARRPRPRNYLAPGERRRVFWRFMPPALLLLLALGWIEQTWFPRGGGPPRAKQVDTRLESVRGARPEGEAVLIEPEPEPASGPFAAEATGLSASPDLLAKVRDDAFFRHDEEPAWIQTWLTLRSGDAGALLAAAKPVSFTELFGQPLSFRGRPVRFKGTLRRLERLKAPANDYDIAEYWQGWLEPAVGPPSPIVVHFMRIPAGMPTGLKINEPVEVAGYFFKRYAYKAVDTIRRAPLVLAIEPVWTPRPSAKTEVTSLGPFVAFAILSLMATALLAALAMCLGNILGNRRRPARSYGTSDLNEALAGEDIVSTGESLRRLAADHASQDPPSVEFDR